MFEHEVTPGCISSKQRNGILLCSVSGTETYGFIILLFHILQWWARHLQMNLDAPRLCTVDSGDGMLSVVQVWAAGRWWFELSWLLITARFLLTSGSSCSSRLQPTDGGSLTADGGKLSGTKVQIWQKTDDQQTTSYAFNAKWKRASRKFK